MTKVLTFEGYQLSELITVNAVNVALAVLILVIGWIVALIISSGVSRAVRSTRLNERLSNLYQDTEEDDKPNIEAMNIDKWISKIVFYVIMFFVIIAFLQQLELTIVAEPFTDLLSQVFNYLPMLVGGIALLLIAWVLATVIRLIILKVLSATNFDARFGERVEEGKKVSASQLISKVAYWLVILLFIPAILSALRLEGILHPIQQMTTKALDFLPNILAAGLIILVGWMGAKILKQIIEALLVSAGVDKLGENVGVDAVIGRQPISRLVGVLVYALIIIVALIAALNALALDAITAPASNMLNMILEALPTIFAAVLVIGIAYGVGIIVKGLIKNLLNAAGFNKILAKLGIGKEPEEGQWTPSDAVSYIVFVVIMLFATIEAAGLLGFALLADLVSQLLVFITHIIIGVIIFAIALYLGNLAYNTVSVTQTPHNKLLAGLAKYSILAFGGAMALQRMGLADEIIILAFGLILGAIAITAIIAFGIGGKDIAARELDEMVKKIKGSSDKDQG